ncbi:J domain-containing protein [Pedobacter sp. ISL-68]|uniref:J domain-containing protein n=1 Tax=unclassified Pedobacter TaxID=2628915 RepID=UPI001BE83366|nr:MULTISPECIES: J domain-containing protein [unclassified Pedobacter]MBT2561325.1 J domain-containing protein [Pedobacter sp. ISL-64]MBT2590714.1 J domain-containing protein [Pedobacter sp. ISL-68]
MKFFKDCKTLDEVKARYKKLALQYHPDKGGDTATMQAINSEYAFASAKLVKGANLSEEETEQEMKFSEEYRKVIEQIIHLPSIKVEAIGLWIWVTGETYPVRSELKAAGLFFAPKKQAWYYRSELYKATRGGKKTLDQIRDKYGSEIIRTEKRKTLNTAFSNH